MENVFTRYIHFLQATDTLHGQLAVPLVALAPRQETELASWARLNEATAEVCEEYSGETFTLSCRGTDCPTRKPLNYVNASLLKLLGIVAI